MSFQAVLILAAFVSMVMGQAQPTPFITPPPDGVLRTPVLVTPPVTPPSTTTTSPTTTVTPARATTPEAIVSRQPLTTTPAPVAVVNPLSPIAAPVNPTTTTTVVTSATPLLGQTINCADLINFLRPQCQCSPYYSRNLTTGLCQLNCTAVPYSQGLSDRTSGVCLCQRGYFWSISGGSCYRDCKNVPHSSGNNAGNPTVCNCVRPFVPDGDSCRLDCKRMSYSTGEMIDGKCKCNSNYRWDTIMRVCISGVSNQSVKLGVGLGVGLGLLFLLASVATCLGLYYCPPKKPTFVPPPLAQPTSIGAYYNPAMPPMNQPYPQPMLNGGSTPPSQFKAGVQYPSNQNMTYYSGVNYGGPMSPQPPMNPYMNNSGINRSVTVLPPYADVVSSKTIYGGVNFPTQETIVGPVMNRTSIIGPPIYRI